MITDIPLPFSRAMQLAKARGVFPASLGSAELSRLEQEVKRRAVFSARTTNADYLQGVGDVVNDMTAGKINLAEGRDRLKRMLDALEYTPEHGFPGDAEVPPADEGSLQDLSSDERINLMLRTQVLQAQGFGFFTRGTQDRDRLAQYPAWEIVRVAWREVPRGMRRGKAGAILPDPDQGWPVRWDRAGGDFYDGGRMIALKNDAVWQALGDGEGGYSDTLGQPYPPFAFNSGMGVREIARSECVRLGLIGRNEFISAPTDRGLNEGVEIRTEHRDAALMRDIARELRTMVKDGKLSLSAGSVTSALRSRCAMVLNFLEDALAA